MLLLHMLNVWERHPRECLPRSDGCFWYGMMGQILRDCPLTASKGRDVRQHTQPSTFTSCATEQDASSSFCEE